MIIDILEDKDQKVNQIMKQTTIKIENIIKNEFSDFNNVEVRCSIHDADTVRLTKEKNWVDFRIKKGYFDSKPRLRKTQNGNRGFTEEEIEKIRFKLEKLL